MTAPEAQQVEAETQRAEFTQPTAGNIETAVPGSATALAFVAGSHAPTASHLKSLQRAAGNGAVAHLLGGIQRAPTAAAGAKSKSNAAASYIDLFNAFQEMAGKAVDSGGAGMDNVPFGKDLNADHRRLLESVRDLFDQARTAGDAGRKKLAGQWQPLAAKLQKTVGEARRLGLSSEVLSGVSDAIDLVGRDYVGTHKTRQEMATEVYDDEQRAMLAMLSLVDAFLEMGEPSKGVMREEVTGRKDVVIPQSVREQYSNIRKALDGVKFGNELVGRHKTILEQMRRALKLARTEAPNSAYNALVLWQSIVPDLLYIWERGSKMGIEQAESDPVKISKNVSVADYKGKLDQISQTLALHRSLAHEETLESALTQERSAEQVASDKKVERSGTEKEVADLKEMRAVADVKHALDIIQNHIQPDPNAPGQSILTSGSTVVRIWDDQVQGLRASATKAVRHYAAISASLADDAYEAFKARRAKNREHPIVHKIVSWSADIDNLDPDEMLAKETKAQEMLRQVASLADGGDFVAAFNVAISLEMWSQGFARKVGEWESGLVSYAGKWVIGMTIAKELLTIVATAGAGELISGAKAARGISGLRATAEVAGASTAVGGVAGGGAYVAGQVATGQEISGSDLFQATRVAGGTAFTATAGAGAVGSAKEALGVGKAATTLGNVARGATAEVLGNVPVNVIGAGIKNENLKEAAISSSVSSVVSGGAGQALAKVAEGGKVAKTVVGGTVGGTSSAAGALAAGKDAGDVGKSLLFGTAGGALGPHLSESNQAYLKGGAAGSGGSSGAGGTGGEEGGGTTAPPSLDTKAAISGAGGTTPTESGTPALAPGSAAATTSTGATATPGGAVGEPIGSSTVGTGKTSGTAGTGGKSGTSSTSGGGTEQETWQGRPANADLPDEPVGAAIGRGIPKVNSRDVATPDAVVKEGVGVGNMFTPIKRGVMKPIGRPPGGTSEAVVVVDTTNNNKKYLFKPLGGEPDVPYAEDRGVVAGHYAERARAGAISAGELGVETPGVRMVEINGRKGSLTEWVEPSEGGQVMGLGEYAKQNEQRFADLQKTPEFIEALSGIEALDYLINNVDRVNNLGNYMIEIGPGGSFKRLVPIDQELSFTRTADRAIVPGKTSMMPRRWTPELAERVAALHDNPGEFVTKIRPLVGDAAVDGVMARLNQLYENGVQRGAIKPGGGGGRGGAGGGAAGGIPPGGPLAPGGETAATGQTVAAAPTGSRRITVGGPNEPPLPADVDVEGAVARGLSEHDADQQPYGAPQRPVLTEIESAAAGPSSPQQQARTDAATQGEIGYQLPHPAAADQARARLRGGAGTPADALTVIRQAVGVSRAQMSGEIGQGGMSGEALAGRCMMARDLTALSVAAQLEGSGVPATIRRYSVNGLAGRVTGQAHQFTVVEFRFPGRTESFILDPTYAQFISPGGGTRAGLEGDRARGGAGSSEVIARLLEDGYVPLNGTTGRAYLDSLVPPGQATIDVGRLLAGVGGIDPGGRGPGSHIEAGPGSQPLSQQLENLPYLELMTEDFARASASLREQGRPDLAHEVDELSALLQHHGLDNPRPFTAQDFIDARKKVPE